MINSIFNTASSAMNAYMTMLNNTANNVANMNTLNYRPLETNFQEQTGGGVTATTGMSQPNDRVDLSKEVVDMILAETGFKANIDSLKTAQAAQNSVIDIIA